MQKLTNEEGKFIQDSYDEVVKTLRPYINSYLRKINFSDPHALDRALSYIPLAKSSFNSGKSNKSWPEYAAYICIYRLMDEYKKLGVRTTRKKALVEKIKKDFYKQNMEMPSEEAIYNKIKESNIDPDRYINEICHERKLSSMPPSYLIQKDYRTGKSPERPDTSWSILKNDIQNNIDKILERRNPKNKWDHNNIIKNLINLHFIPIAEGAEYKKVKEIAEMHGLQDQAIYGIINSKLMRDIFTEDIPLTNE